MTNKLAALQRALDTTKTASTAGSPAPVKPSPSPTASGRQANRHGKVNIAAWMDPAFKNSLRLVQARRPGSIQDLIEEALNDLFSKYDVPTITKVK